MRYLLVSAGWPLVLPAKVSNPLTLRLIYQKEVAPSSFTNINHNIQKETKVTNNTIWYSTKFLHSLDDTEISDYWIPTYKYLPRNSWTEWYWCNLIDFINSLHTHKKKDDKAPLLMHVYVSKWTSFEVKLLFQGKVSRQVIPSQQNEILFHLFVAWRLSIEK